MISPKFRVAVVGGGITGLTFALALSKLKANVEVDVYEGARSFSEVGAGILMWPRSLAILRQLDILDDLIATQPEYKGPDQPSLVFHLRKADLKKGIDAADIISQGAPLQLRRTDLQSILLKHLPQNETIQVHNAKRLATYEQPKDSSRSQIKLHFQDGTTAECDLLLGADGVHSATRKAMYSDPTIDGSHADTQSVQAFWSGIDVHRTLIPVEKIRALNPEHPALFKGTQYFGTNAAIIAYNVTGRFVNFVAMTKPQPWESPLEGPAVRESSRDEVAQFFVGWEKDVQEFLECIETVKCWAVEVCPTLKTYVSGRVALIGDAAHAMLPAQGAGGGQGIEDACILAHLLADDRVTVDKIPKVLQIYDDIRRPLSQEVARRSRLQANYVAGEKYGKAEFDDVRAFTEADAESQAGKARLFELSATMTQNLAWTWSTSFETDVKRALTMLE